MSDPFATEQMTGVVNDQNPSIVAAWHRQESAAQVADYLREVLASIAKLEEEAGELRAWLAQRYADGTHEVGDVKVTVYQMRRFDAAQAAKVLDPMTLMRVSRLTVDRKLAEKHLSPEEYSQCQIDGKRTVRLA